MKLYSIVIIFLSFLPLTSCLKGETILQPQQENDEILFIASAGNRISLDGIWKAECVQTNLMSITETFVFVDSVFTIQIEMYDEEKCRAEPVNVRNVRVEFKVIGTIKSTLGDITVTANKIKGKFKFDDVGEYEEYKQSIYIEESGNMLILFHGIFEEDGGILSQDGYPIDLFHIPISKISD